MGVAAEEVIVFYVCRIRIYHSHRLLWTIYSLLGVATQILLRHDIMSIASSSTTSVTSVSLLTTSLILNLSRPMLRFPSTRSLHPSPIALCSSVRKRHNANFQKVGLRPFQTARPLVHV